MSARCPVSKCHRCLAWGLTAGYEDSLRLQHTQSLPVGCQSILDRYRLDAKRSHPIAAFEKSSFPRDMDLAIFRKEGDWRRSAAESVSIEYRRAGAWLYG